MRKKSKPTSPLRAAGSQCRCAHANPARLESRGIPRNGVLVRRDVRKLKDTLDPCAIDTTRRFEIDQDEVIVRAPGNERVFTRHELISEMGRVGHHLRETAEFSGSETARTERINRAPESGTP